MHVGPVHVEVHGRTRARASQDAGMYIAVCRTTGRVVQQFDSQQGTLQVTLARLFAFGKREGQRRERERGEARLGIGW